MQQESNKQTVSFKEPKEWVLNEKTVRLTKIETTTHDWTPIVPKHKVLETLDPKTVLYNVIKNVALLPNGSFFEVDNKRILARINDTSGETLIRTQWHLPIDAFNETVVKLIVNEKIAEDKFHIISKAS